jgi:hypothetical protein
MFNCEEDKPLPSWEAIDWLLKDYGNQREETKPWNMAYDKIKNEYQDDPFLAVQMNKHFCKDCDKRYKWDPHGNLDSLEYNYPKIPSKFTTANECVVSYEAFFDKHKTYTDLACYTAIVYCKFLAYFCKEHGIICNINRFSKLRKEMHILIKIHYKCSRWMRMIKVMATTSSFL